VIREARRDEAEALAAIQRDASLAANAHIFPPELYPFPTGEIVRRWQDFLDDPDVTVLVFDEGGAALGVTGSRAEWLDGLYVLPEWWGHGVGRRLHDEVLDRHLRTYLFTTAPLTGVEALAGADAPDVAVASAHVDHSLRIGSLKSAST